MSIIYVGQEDKLGKEFKLLCELGANVLGLSEEEKAYIIGEFYADAWAPALVDDDDKLDDEALFTLFECINRLLTLKGNIYIFDYKVKDVKTNTYSDMYACYSAANEEAMSVRLVEEGKKLTYDASLHHLEEIKKQQQ